VLVPGVAAGAARRSQAGCLRFAERGKLVAQFARVRLVQARDARVARRGGGMHPHRGQPQAALHRARGDVDKLHPPVRDDRLAADHDPALDHQVIAPLGVTPRGHPPGKEPLAQQPDRNQPQPDAEAERFAHDILKYAASKFGNANALGSRKLIKTHTEVKKVKKVVGYGLQLREKQKAKRIYFTLETQFRAYYQKASNKTGVTGELLLQQLETRLDNVAYRLGFAMSRRQARQVVRHGHLQVNGRKVNIPSFQVKVGDEIAIREGSKSLPQFEEAKNFAAGQNQVQWIDINRDNLSGKIIALPKREDVNLPVNEQLIVELYSK